jgi:pyrroline-5-carboxylate reductase
MTDKIAILGGGNIGLSLARGLIISRLYKPESIIITRRRTHMIEYMSEEGVVVSSDNAMAARTARIIFVTVKPQQAMEVLAEIAPDIQPQKHILISLVTGLGIEKIRTLVGPETPVFLAMPNTALALCESMTCISHGDECEKDKEEVASIFNHLGKCLTIPEELMGASTVLAACGVAFALRFLRSIAQGGIEIGFGAEISTLIAAQTLKGAARLAQESGNHPEHEIDKVTTPMGITISGLNEMEHNGFSSALIKGLLASYRKIENLNGKKTD